ncbi:HNH endonuclease [Amycolatopsis sp. WQ 127309]|uniref:HNH endonuclease n=1 Tax=Amycolatopsis sp. WQ 127309 TaxID=2932773 RepID=UPI001FF4C164|nr:HNH endonuclease [Amycolatopsis sp. WQ 127309]UOZ09384.1 HNH endonuclease [Amycolatopsis sp. WQ 127309]
MSISDVTRDAILQAIAEHDRNPETFLQDHGFGPARTYMLVHEHREYDSKAIVGVAHGYLDDQDALTAADFSGGLETVVKLLHDREFEVRAQRSPAWLEAELVLACDLVAGNGWRVLRTHDPHVAEVSRLLQLLPLHPPETRGTTFRNVNSVHRKIADIATQHPDYQGRPTRGGKLDREILQAFLDRPDEMHAEAGAIRVGITSGTLTTLPAVADPDEEEAIAEGRALVLLHLRRERNPKLRAKKLDQVLTARGCLACEVCGFDFERIYGERGARYAEVHHVVPLHVTGPTTTRLADLAVLCANCHRMIHRGSQWLTPAELRALVEQHAGSRA